MSVAPLTEIDEVPARDPAEVTSVPPETVVEPVKVFAPVRLSVPAPVLANVPAPPRMPATVCVEPLFATNEVARSSPVVPVIAPAENVTVPDALLKAPRFSVPPLIVRSPGSALATPSWSVPPVREVPPVKVFAAESVTSPAVDFERVPPASVAVTVPLLSVTFETSTVPPVSVPPASVRALAKVCEFRSKVPLLLIVIPPEPKASAFVPLSVPAETVTAPENPVLVPETVSVPPGPFMVSEPAPAKGAASETAVPAVTFSAVAVSTPPEEMIVPPAKVTVPAVWSNVPRSSEPPLTLKAFVEASWAALPKTREPALTVVVPE